MDIEKAGAFIAGQRKLKHMTQKELAQKLNVTDKAVSKWERGIGYPEITTIPLLAEVLGVSTSEIISGERADMQCMFNSDVIVPDAKGNGQNLHSKKASHAKDITITILSVALLIGTFVCSLCNYIISDKFDWSLYVFGGAVTAWMIVVPLLKFGKYRCILSMAGLSIAIVPFLLLIEYLCPEKNWVIPFALPLTIISLVSLWIFILLLTFAKMRLIKLITLALVLFGVVDNLVIHQFVGHYLKLSFAAQSNPSAAIVAITCGFIAISLFIVTAFFKKVRPIE